MRNKILDEACLKIFGKDFDYDDWHIAELVVENFDVRRLGEDLARQVIFQIVNHVFYPDQEITTRIVGRAEALASELFSSISDEPHMAELEWLEHQTKTPDQ